MYAPGSSYKVKVLGDRMLCRNAYIAAFIGTLLLGGCGDRNAPSSALQSSARQVHTTQSPSTRLATASAPPPAAAPSPAGNAVERPDRPGRPPTEVAVAVDVLQNRHPISSLVYGVNFGPSTSYLSDSGATFVRWGGNAASRYNWTNFDTNSGSGAYFANRAMVSTSGYQDSTAFVNTLSNAGAAPLMTIGLLPWVAKDATSYSFSTTKYGAQCAVSPLNSDEGDGLSSDCVTTITSNDPNDAHVPLLDYPQDGDPANAIYRNGWVMALASQWAPGSHFYGMDNEMDIWAIAHRDVHPAPVTYNEMRGTFLNVVKPMKAWDPNAQLFAPVSSSWWYYWNSAAGASDKAQWAGLDFLPWWLNEVAVMDQVEGSRSLDVLDVHSYIDSPDTSAYTLTQKQALALRISRDWWDPTYTSESPAINQGGVTAMQPLEAIPFRIPRLRAMLNSIDPGTNLSISEWDTGSSVWGSAAESDFSTALADADAYGILGRERVYAASRAPAADANTPAYQALKLFQNYDGSHHTFGSTSVLSVNSGDPNLFSSYASIDASGNTLTILLINKSAYYEVPASIALSNFTAMNVTAYTLSAADPQEIVASSSQSWTDAWTLAPYSATLLVITGQSNSPAVEWDLNPDTVMMPANGTWNLHPHVVAGSGTLTLTAVQSDPGIALQLSQPNVSSSQDGTVTVAAGAVPGFYRYSVSGTDSLGVPQIQSGWIVVGNPAATLSKIGDNQSAPAGSVVTLAVTLDPAQSGATGVGATILFTNDAGDLPNRLTRTNGSNTASVQITLPATPGTVQVTAEGPIPLGHPVATFTITAQ